MNLETGTLQPGEARCPAETTQEIIARDKVKAPAWAASESYEYLGSEDVSKDRYTEADFAKGEFAKLWTRTWQMACREEHIPEVGDYYVFDIGGNKYRLITAIHFNRQMVFIRYVFTHKEYDKWKP